MSQVISNENALSAQDIAQRVRAYLQTHPINGITLDIVEQAVRRDDNWWYVPVRLNTDAPRTY